MAAGRLIDIVVFDWSGVISDDRMPVFEAIMRMLERYGKPAMQFDEFFAKASQTHEGFMAMQGINGDPGELESIYTGYYKVVLRSGIRPKIYPGTRGVLDYLKKKGKRLSVLSSHPEKLLLDEVEQYGIRAYFDAIIGSAKDKAMELARICRENPAHGNEVLYVCDMIQDIISAKKAGVLSAGICTGYHSRDMLMAQKPDFLIKDFSELERII